MATSSTQGGQGGAPISAKAGGAKVGSQIGRSLPRLEARDKVTGSAEYTHTMRLPGMLHAKIFRSTVAHGRIKSIDTSAAKRVPGVHRIITAEDIRTVIPEIGRALCREKV